MGLTYFSDEEIYSFLDKELEGVVLEVELIQRASRSVSSASFEASDIERLSSEASFELPPLFLKKTFELWGEENQDEDKEDKTAFQNEGKEAPAYSEPRGIREHIVQQCMHGTKLGKKHSLYRSNFSELVDEPSGRVYRYFLYLLEQEEYSWLDGELFEIAANGGKHLEELTKKDEEKAELLARLTAMISAVRYSSRQIDERLEQLQYELHRLASSSEDFGSLNDAETMDFLKSIEPFETSLFANDFSNLGDRVFAEVKQFQQDKEIHDAELAEMGLSSSITDNPLAMRRLQEHLSSQERVRSLLNETFIND